MEKEKKYVIDKFEDTLGYFLRDAEIKQAYDALETEEQVKRALIELRLKNEQTQKKLAEKLETKQAYISRVESGAVSPTVNYIARMADALNADAEIIFRPRGSKEIIRAVLVKETKREYKAK